MAFSILGVDLHEIASQQELQSIFAGFLDGDRTRRIFTPNPEILLLADADPGYAATLRTADLALPDGTGVALVGFVRTGRIVRRWPGIDIGATLMRLAGEKGATVAFVGSTEAVAQRAASRWRSAMAGLDVRVFAGTEFDQTGRARSEHEERELVAALAAAAPAVVLVALGAPKQERWIERHADDFPSVRIMAGVGGTLDIWAGHLPRAPVAFRRLGLEWLWRLVLEPSRWRRIARATLVFPALALADRPRRRPTGSLSGDLYPRSMMRIVVVSTLPPRHCGIGAYAAAQVEQLRRDGHDVTVISPPDGRGDVRVPFDDGRPFREAERRGEGADRILVHFQPGLYYRPGATAAVSKIRTSMALLSLVRQRRQTEILVHEAHTPTRWRPDHLILRRAFARASLIFHTEAERMALAREYRLEPHGRLIDHAEAVHVTVPDGKADARRRLGVDPDEPLLLCAGFIHPWKGFDRAIVAFERSGITGRLAIIGSVRDHTPENRVYAARLREMAARSERVQFVETYQSDEEFDAWVAAADRVVLPYTRGWSSGVLARAKVIGTPAIVSAVGGLVEQAGPDDEIVRSDAELERAFSRLGATARPGKKESDLPASATDADR